MRSFPILSCLLLCVSYASAQDRQVVPVFLNQFYQHVEMVNPAATAYQYKSKVIVANKSLDGIFKDVRTNFVAANIRLGLRDSTNRDSHGIGLTLLESREGSYISRSRVQASYAWHNSISYNWMLSLGVMAGFINYLYKATDIYPSQSALRFTSDVGVFLYQPKKINIGLSLNQFVKSDMAPLEPGLKVKPFGTFIIDYTAAISPVLDWRNALICRGPIHKSSFDADLTSAIVVQKMVTAGVHYKVHKGYSFLIGLESGQMKKNGINLFFSYYKPFLFKDNINVPEVELTISFFRH